MNMNKILLVLVDPQKVHVQFVAVVWTPEAEHHCSPEHHCSTEHHCSPELIPSCEIGGCGLFSFLLSLRRADLGQERVGGTGAAG